MKGVCMVSMRERAGYQPPLLKQIKGELEHMKSLNTLIEEWYLVNVGKEGQKNMDLQVSGFINWLRDEDEQPNEEGLYTVWAMDIVSGAHGQFATELFNREITGSSAPTKNGLERVIEKYDIICEELAVHLNKHTSLPGQYYIGQHEADGSIGIMYCERADA
jgi:hypothetical protein